MLKLFEKLFASSNTTKGNMAQIEREAIVDLLLLAIYADNHISLDENQVLEDGLDGLGWESGTSLSIYMNSATTKARAALADQEVHDDFLNTIVERISSKASKEKALSLLLGLFDSDGTSVAEASFYKEVELKLLPS